MDMPSLKVKADSHDLLSWLESESTLSTKTRACKSTVRDCSGDTSNCDVTVSMDDGCVRTHRMILSALSPFLLRLLLQEERHHHGDGHNVIVLPGVRARHLRALIAAVLSPHSRVASNKGRLCRLREALSALAPPLQLQHPAFRLPSPCQSAEDSSSSGGAPLYLSDVDVMGLSDETITDSFGDQKARLVCLVCYKIFAPDDHSKYREHVVRHDVSRKRRIKIHEIRKDRQEVEETTIPPQEPIHIKPYTRNIKIVQQADNPQSRIKLPPPPVPPARERKIRRPREPPNTTCKECGKTFVDSTRLRVHLRIHLGQRPFSCQSCDKSFTQRRTLVEHERIHACAAAADSSSSLRCPDCPARFVQPNHLRTHRASVHGLGDKLQRCPHCPKVFAFPFQLARHQNRMHQL